MNAQTNRYALLDVDPRVDGEGITWWLYLYTLSAPHIGEFPLEAAERRGWWRVPAHVDFRPETTIVENVAPGGRDVVGYRRTTEVADPNLPETLSPDEYDERVDPDDGAYDRRVRALYDPEYVDRPPKRTPVEGPWLVLEGAPPPDDGMDWHADLPHELRHRPEYLHLFPGHFSGFRDALRRALEEVPGVSVYAPSGGPLSVNVRLDVPKLEPPEKWAARPHLSGASARERKRILERHNAGIQQVTRQLEIPVADHVQGTNRAGARAVWDASISEVVEYVRGVVAEKCPTCKGRGFVDLHNHQED